MIWKAYLRHDDIMELFGCGKTSAYNVMDAILTATDKEGNLIVDPAKMPPLGCKFVPTECAIKVFPHIKKSFTKLSEVDLPKKEKGQ